MEANRRANTKPERLLRSALHARGLRYRKDRRFDIDGQRVRPDVVFAGTRVAVFVDGCFWHRCPEHGTSPKANADFWQSKLDRNVARDRANDAALKAAGWTVVRVWEHEEPDRAAERIAELVREASGPAAHRRRAALR